MAVIYIKEQGALVQKLGERMVVTKNRQTLLDVPVFKIDNIAVIGNVQITMQALRMFIEHGIDVGYFTYGGKYIGHTCAETSKNIFLRFEQHNIFLDMDKRMDMAKIIVSNKIRNQIALIGGHRWSSEDDYDWRSAVEKMISLKESLNFKSTINEAMGVEGICSNIYFSAFSKMIKGDFVFEKRNRRPPKDPVNIILSLAYTFLTRELCNVLDAESFETYLGFLHGIKYGRKSLALDMIEEFRQPIVDRFVLMLFSKRMLGKYHFELTEDGLYTLTEDGFKKFCYEYERWMTGKNSLAGDNFRKSILEQVGKLKKFFTQGEKYCPYCWEVHRVFD